MTYADPITALGPTLYVLWHNGYNAWQMSRGKENAGEKENTGAAEQDNSENR